MSDGAATAVPVVAPTGAVERRFRGEDSARSHLSALTPPASDDKREAVRGSYSADGLRALMEALHATEVVFTILVVIFGLFVNTVLISAATTAMTALDEAAATPARVGPSLANM